MKINLKNRGGKTMTIWDPYAEFESTVLPNGLSVYAAQWKGRPWQAMGFLIHGGAMYDSVGLEGTAHFVEHMVSENAPISFRDLEENFKSRGGSVMFGRTSYLKTEYGFFAPIDQFLKRDFDLFGRMLFLEKMEKNLERERKVIIEEFNEKYPFSPLFEVFMRGRRTVFEGEWLERFVTSLGDSISINNITQKDLQLFYDMNYVPANMSIVGVGGLALSEIVAMLKDSPFAIDKAGSRVLPKFPIASVSPLQENRYDFEMSKHVKDASLLKAASYQSIAKIPGNIKNQVARITRAMLNDALRNEMRERRAWTYGIDTSYDNYDRFCLFSIECNSFKLEALGQMGDVVDNCIDSIRDDKDLFLKIKGRALAEVSMNDITGKDLCEGAMSDIYYFGRVVSSQEFKSWIDDVSMEDVVDFLKWLEPKQRWTLIVRP